MGPWCLDNHRDTNVALNIAAAGQRRLAEGIPLLSLGEDVKLVAVA